MFRRKAKTTSVISAAIVVGTTEDDWTLGAECGIAHISSMGTNLPTGHKRRTFNFLRADYATSQG